MDLERSSVFLCVSEARGLCQRSVQHCSSNLSRIKVFLRQHASQSALVLIVLHDPFQAASSMWQITKSKQAGRIRKKSTRARMLNKGRFTAGQVAQCAVADPSILQSYTRRPDTRKLAQGVLDVALVIPGSVRHLLRLAQAPSVFPQHQAFVFIVSQVDYELQRLAREPRQTKEWQEAAPFVVRIGLVTILHPSLEPVRHSGERRIFCCHTWC